jgi:3-hydroxyisobutyrate dehydrogenase-like beta-hydroxyacid dehydrogenase
MALDDFLRRPDESALSKPRLLRIAQVGYGEVGTIFAAALAQSGQCAVRAFDILVDDRAWREGAQARAQANGVALASDIAEAVGDADIVICAVTAASSAQAAGAIARALRPGSFVLDVNSASPQTKSACAQAVNAAGGRYVEAAVMSAVPPYGLRVPMLLGGPEAQKLQPVLARLGFDAQVGSAQLGVVSAIKLCRSVIIKGIEALAVESFLAARRYGVEKEVIASLAESFPGMDWEKQANYCWKRVVQHGARRAEEMREAAVTVRDAGLAPHMASATAQVQSWVAALKRDGAFADAPADAAWADYADRIARKRP